MGPLSGTYTTGARAILNCGLFRHRGTGAVYLDVYNVTRLIIDSPNYGLAAGITMTSSLTSLEIIRGRATLAAAAGTALPDQIMVADPQGLSENLRLTADSTLTGALLVVAPGRVSVDGCDWTSGHRSRTLAES